MAGVQQVFLSSRRQSCRQGRGSSFSNSVLVSSCERKPSCPTLHPNKWYKRLILKNTLDLTIPVLHSGERTAPPVQVTHFLLKGGFPVIRLGEEHSPTCHLTSEDTGTLSLSLYPEKSLSLKLRHSPGDPPVPESAV